MQWPGQQRTSKPGRREGIHGAWRYLIRLRRGAGVRSHEEDGVDPGHATESNLVEFVENLWYRGQAVRQRETEDPAVTG
jgi:hypothetical protein